MKILFGCCVILLCFSDEPEDTNSSNMDSWTRSFSWNRESISSPSTSTRPLCPGGAWRGSGRVCKAFEPSARRHPQKSIDTLAVCMGEMLGSRGALQRSCCSCYGEPWVTQKQNIMYCELEGSIASVTVRSAAWLSCQAKGIIHQRWESWCADHVVLPLLELSVLPHHGLFGVSRYNGNLTALLMQSAQSLHGKVTQGEASLLSLKGLWISVGKRTESSVCFFFFHRNITFMILALQHRETVVQYDEYSGRGGVLQGAKYVGNTLLYLTKEFVSF